MINKYLSQIAATILPALMARSDQPGYSETEAIFESVRVAKTLSDAVSEIITPKKQDAPVNQDAQSAIQQGAVDDLPAVDGGTVAYETALLVWEEYRCKSNRHFPIGFDDYCKRQLTALAGR